MSANDLPPGATRPAVLRDHADLDRLDGRSVEVIGRYEAIASPRKGPPDPAAARDHAVIVLDDGTRLYLDPLGSPAARRPAVEIETFDGRLVRVAGIARRQMPAGGATLVAPCLEGATIAGSASGQDDPGRASS